MTVGDRIKRKRLKLKMSIDELAHKLDKNRATIYRYESNEIENFPTTILEPLAKALGTTPAYLMGWEDNPSMQSLDEQKNTHLSEAERRVLELTHEHPELANMLAEITEIITNFSDEKLDAFLIFLKTMNNPE